MDWCLLAKWCITHMMTLSNGNIFHVTGPLCGEFTSSGEFPTQRPMLRNFDVFFDLRLNKRLSKQPWGWWFETPSWSLWRRCNDQEWYGIQSQRKRVNVCISNWWTGSTYVYIMVWCWMGIMLSSQWKLSYHQCNMENNIHWSFYLNYVWQKCS